MPIAFLIVVCAVALFEVARYRNALRNRRMRALCQPVILPQHFG